LARIEVLEPVPHNYCEFSKLTGHNSSFHVGMQGG